MDPLRPSLASVQNEIAPADSNSFVLRLSTPSTYSARSRRPASLRAFYPDRPAQCCQRCLFASQDRISKFCHFGMRLAWIAGLADLHKRWNIQSIVAPRVSPRVTPVQLRVLNVDWVFDYMFKTHAHIIAYIHIYIYCIIYIYMYIIVHILTHKLFLHLPVKKILFPNKW